MADTAHHRGRRRRSAARWRRARPRTRRCPRCAAALLTAEPVVLENVPALADVRTTRALLERLGGRRSDEPDGSTRVARARGDEPRGALRARLDHARLRARPGPAARARPASRAVALPGGCAIGVRPIDQHLKGLRRSSARRSSIQNGYVEARASRLKGARITTDLVTVTGTENLMMAAALAEGTTVIENAAREPEVTDLARLLAAMGARIQGAGTERIEIEGVAELGGARHRIIPDRIEAGTLLVAGGHHRRRRHRDRRRAAAPHRDPRQAGGVRRRRSTVDRRSRAVPGPGAAARGRHDHEPVPGLPHRHAGAAHGAARPGRRDQSKITETIFENRFMHAAELDRLGARIETEGSDRGGPRRPRLSGRAGHGHRSPRLRLAGAGRAGRARHAPRSRASITWIAATSGSRRSCARSAPRIRECAR